MGDQVSTTTNYAGPQSTQAREFLRQLQQAGAGATGQMGDLSNLAAGNLELSPQMMALIQQIQEQSMQAARGQQDINMQQTLRGLEDSNIARGIDESSLAAVNQALLGQQQMADLNALTAGGQVQASQMMLNAPFQAAQTQMGANQALLNRLVQPAQVGVNYDAMIRGMTGSQQTAQPFNMAGSLFQLGGQLGAAQLGKA